MIVLDQNFRRDQRDTLIASRIRVKQIGFELGRAGMKDDELVPFLIQLPRPSFFTMDRGWYMRSLLHARYFVAVLEVPDNEAAGVMRRILKHPDFSTQAGRLGKVIRASHGGMTGWKIGAESEIQWTWV